MHGDCIPKIRRISGLGNIAEAMCCVNLPREEKSSINASDALITFS